MLTERERTVLHCIASSAVPIDTAMRCAELCGIAMSEARRTIESLQAAGLIHWVVPLHDLGVEMAPARWEPTAAGRQELTEA